MIKLDKLFFTVFGLFVFFFSCKEDSKKIIKTEMVTFTKEGTLAIYKGQTDSIVVNLDIEIAESSYETETGLMYRKSMAKNQGMLFIFPDVRQHFFHMKNTEFGLDIVFLDENLKIASFQENARPFDEKLLPSQVPVKYALEINAGLSEKWLLEIGDRVEFNKL
ncbi:DUF192 domain-containing protein [Maribacter sp. HTCC2170]|uniref:DUF192 domain-containing protein n=1 Tax=Maribacter sp. (strain HTCC2170 / KCCM 42371) TaxID=313603 RepID=UPI00006B6E95|nr:DUF192 domain-containing protein [Maribacter sp. HTCC2170]EAQ99646.1 hypothetical protein FB2170_01761 [Maribacter sp. HTCC2170]